MSVYLPPPTYADVILIGPPGEDGSPGQPKFNPIWLDWFVRLTQNTTSGATTDHNTLANLQGGSANQYYHLTAALAAATAAAFAAQSANRVLAGPSSGSAAAPAFRALVAADLPGGTGTVTSVAQTVPAEFSIGGSPVTTSGTLAITKATQTANTVWVGPASGAAAQPAFRALTSADGAVDAWTAFTTTRTGWTDVGSPTVTSRYSLAGHVCFFQIKVVPATTVATVGATSYCSLPITAAGLGGDGSMTDRTSLLSIGNCVIDVTNSRVYVPSQVATSDTLLIAGWHEV